MTYVLNSKAGIVRLFKTACHALIYEIKKRPVQKKIVFFILNLVVLLRSIHRLITMISMNYTKGFFAPRNYTKKINDTHISDPYSRIVR